MIIEKLCKDTELYGNAARPVIRARPDLCLLMASDKIKMV